MVIVLPTPEDIRSELEPTPDKKRDTEWSFKFKAYADVDPADVHGA